MIYLIMAGGSFAFAPHARQGKGRHAAGGMLNLGVMFRLRMQKTFEHLKINRSMKMLTQKKKKTQRECVASSSQVEMDPQFR